MTHHRYGPNSKVVEYVLWVQIREMTAARYEAISAAALLNDPSTDAQDHALQAARETGREEAVVTASEDLRRAIWGVIWDSSWADAWRLSWLAARAGLGIATSDLIGTGNYTITDYINLVAPWMAGYKDMPLNAVDAPLSA